MRLNQLCVYAAVQLTINVNVEIYAITYIILRTVCMKYYLLIFVR